jgi:hypothetical protein
VSTPQRVTSIWARAVADPVFRDALIDDPLRALADAAGVSASPEQIRQLEEMDREGRERLVTGVVREVYARGGQARFGSLPTADRIRRPG